MVRSRDSTFHRWDHLVLHYTTSGLKTTSQCSPSHLTFPASPSTTPSLPTDSTQIVRREPPREPDWSTQRSQHLACDNCCSASIQTPVVALADSPRPARSCAPLPSAAIALQWLWASRMKAEVVMESVVLLDEEPMRRES